LANYYTMKKILNIINAINNEITDLNENEINEVVKLCRLYNGIPETAAEKIATYLSGVLPVKVEADLILDMIQ